jgi:hypothetical protein
LNKATTVKQYVSALRSKHVDKSLPTTVFSEPSIARILAGATKIQGARPIRERLEITKDILLKMLSQVNTSTFDGLNIYASFSVAFSGFFRPGELTWDKWDSNTSPMVHVSRKSVRFTPDGVVIHLPKSKTDQIGQGTNLTLSFANDASCPVQALRRLFKKYPRPNSDPLFSRSIGPFNKRWFSENITSSLFKAGVPNSSKYSGHSFRRGAANTAVEAGLSLNEVKTLGRWQSDAAIAYLTTKSTDKLKFAINKRLHEDYKLHT